MFAHSKKKIEIAEMFEENSRGLRKSMIIISLKINQVFNASHKSLKTVFALLNAL